MNEKDNIKFIRKFLISTIINRTGIYPFVIIKGSNGYVELQTSTGLITEKFKFRHWKTFKPYQRLVDSVIESISRHSGLT